MPNATLTDTELLVLRYAPKDSRLSSTLRGYDSVKIELAQRGLLIAKRLPWAVEVLITPAGLNAVWDHAHEDLRHLRPDADELAEVAAMNKRVLECWAQHGREVFTSTTEAAA